MRTTVKIVLLLLIAVILFGCTENKKSSTGINIYTSGIHKLEYNNQELLVDLDAGFKILPMPMDFDGDGDREIAIAFKHPVADQILILNGAAGGFAPMEGGALDDGYLVTTHEGRANFQGFVAPVAIDFDRDDIDELVGVYAVDGEVYIEMFDDAHTGFQNLTQ
ncbi:MAG: hypothetical protein L3J54_04065 [Draconibacterium sp.]|nr:hypothetical protein [Draconibacterium sp.]